MATLGATLGKLRSLALRSGPTRAISALERMDALHSSGPLALALRSTVTNSASPSESAWIDRIERLRGELNSSREEIAVIDYGAGDPNLSLTPDEMYRGRRKTSTVGRVCRRASKSSKWARLLFVLVREFKPTRCLELGTCVGISAAYQAAALKMNGKGTLVTLEGSPAFASLARENLRALGLDNVIVVVGRFQDTLDGVSLRHRPLDYVFIDGHHDEEATVAYFSRILPSLDDKAVVVFDDIHWSAGMARAWEAVHAHERVKISVDFSQVGVCVLDSGLKSARRFQVRMP